MDGSSLEYVSGNVIGVLNGGVRTPLIVNSLPVCARDSRLLRSEPVARRGPIDAAIDVVHEVRVAVRRRQMPEPRVERAAAVVLVVPRDRMEVAHALAFLRAPLRVWLVGFL